MDTKQFRKQIAERFVDSLKENPEHWTRQWSVAGYRPENCVSHTEYRGVNRFNLMYAAIEKGSDDMRWATFKQIQQQGWHLRKGAKAEQVEFWQPYDKSIHSAVSWDEYNRAENKENYMLTSRYHQVFNAKDIVGIPPAEKVHNDITQNEAVDRIIEGMGIEVFNDGRDRAYYSLMSDTIHLPLKEKFNNDHAYNSTLLHELSHATGAQTRLARTQSGMMSSTEYAIEELVAEISSCFAGADIGLQYENADFKNHKAYVQSWISEIENKPEVLFNAIKNADQAADYLLEKGGLLKNKGEEVISTEAQSREDVRTPETISINKELKIVRLTGELKFKNSIGFTLPIGYCFMHPEKGYLAVSGSTVPYTPAGGKNALLRIQDDGGFLNYDNMTWIKPVNAVLAAYEKFRDDIHSNGFKLTGNLDRDYKALAEERGSERLPTLSEISDEYCAGSTDGIINAIGDELRAQELQRMEALEQCR